MHPKYQFLSYRFVDIDPEFHIFGFLPKVGVEDGSGQGVIEVNEASDCVKNFFIKAENLILFCLKDGPRCVKRLKNRSLKRI